MVVLDNGAVRAEIAELGAELRKITINGEERLWSGDENVWSGVAPTLFPICGGIKDDKFILDGTEYLLEKHGFARKSNFIVERSNGVSAVFLLKSNEETLKKYPWEFEFRIKYTLTGTAVRVDYEVKNLSDKVMYTSVGAHEGYSCPEGVEDYDIIFEKKETLKTHRLDGTLISHDTDTVLYESDTLPLYNKYFDIDALIFTDIKSRFVTLRNRKTGKSVSVSFDGFDYLLIWSKPQANAPYVCIEPWTTCPSYVNDSYDLSEKDGMKAVNPGETFARTHTIYF